MRAPVPGALGRSSRDLNCCGRTSASRCVGSLGVAPVTTAVVGRHHSRKARRANKRRDSGSDGAQNRRTGLRVRGGKRSGCHIGG